MTQSYVDEVPEPLGRVAAEVPWGTARKVAFRFLFLYLCLYLYPLSATLGWYWGFWVGWWRHTYETPWRQIVPWVAAHILHLRGAVRVGLGGDDIYEYVKVFCFVLIAVLATLIWSVVDRKRTSYAMLNQWARFYVRIVLALTMIGFGTYKIVPIQAPPPDLVTLMLPFGDFGANRLFWAFLGSSAGYEIFAGIVETLGGVMLLIPGMTTLGALISLGALGAVLTQGGFYDVPIKLAVPHLILLALFLLLPDVPRLINLLVLNHATEPRDRKPLFRRRWLNYAVWGSQWALGFCAAVTVLFSAITQIRQRNMVPVTAPLYGIWKIDEFTADGELHPPLLTDDLRWQRVIFESDTRLSPTMVATIQEMNGQFSIPCIAALDTDKGTLSLKSPSVADLESYGVVHTTIDSLPASEQGKAQLKYNRLSPDAMILEGQMNGHWLRVRMTKEERQFKLKERRFHWITEDKDVAY
jgi:hypothetical protein